MADGSRRGTAARRAGRVASPLLTVLLATVVQSAVAAPAPPAVRAEIDALLSRLQTSGCRFNRNGSWHDAAEARTHLMRKLAYLEDRDAVKTTEQFIDRAATGSSSSGKPYLVQCGAAAPAESKVWLTDTLKAVRAPAGAASATR